MHVAVIRLIKHSMQQLTDCFIRVIVTHTSQGFIIEWHNYSALMFQAELQVNTTNQTI